MKRALPAVLASMALGLAAASLSGCATPTPYQPLNPRNALAGGYSDARLDSNHWRVSFAGNSVTSRETVERYLLYHAADLTVGQGFDWFQETDKQTAVAGDVYADPYYGWGWRPYWRFHRAAFYGGFGTWGPGWGYGYGPWGPCCADEFDRFEVSAEIMMGRGPKPPQALDAREVMANLGPGVVRPGAPQPPPGAPPGAPPAPPGPPPAPPRT